MSRVFSKKGGSPAPLGAVSLFPGA